MTSIEPTSRDRVRVVSLVPDVLDHQRAIQRVMQLVREKRGGYVCFSTVHMVMESHDSPEFGAKVNGADMIVTDGMPLVWMQKFAITRRFRSRRKTSRH